MTSAVRRARPNDEAPLGAAPRCPETFRPAPRRDRRGGEMHHCHSANLKLAQHTVDEHAGAKRTRRTSDEQILLAFPKNALQSLQLPDDVIPPTTKALDEHVEALMQLFSGDASRVKEMRKHATMVRAYMLTTAIDGEVPKNVDEHEVEMKGAAAEKDRFERALFGLETGLEPGVASEYEQAAAKLREATLAYDAAKAKLICSLSQQAMRLASDMLGGERRGSSASEGSESASAQPASIDSDEATTAASPPPLDDVDATAETHATPEVERPKGMMARMLPMLSWTTPQSPRRAVVSSRDRSFPPTPSVPTNHDLRILSPFP